MKEVIFDHLYFIGKLKMKIKPFLRWAGGKQNLVDQLLKHTPAENQINKYFEPFLGAGSLYFGNGYNNAVISDVNPQLINTYSSIKFDYKKVHKLLLVYQSRFNLDNQYYYKIRELFNRDRKKQNHIQAARFIFLIHTNYNGMYRVNLKGEYNVSLGKTNPYIPNIEHLKKISTKMADTTIRCKGYQSILKEVKKNDFIYLDPPYPPLDWKVQQKQFKKNHFSKQDHEDLNEFACELANRGCFVLISYPNIEFINDLYKTWNIIHLNSFRSINCKKERKIIAELLIKNY